MNRILIMLVFFGLTNLPAQDYYISYLVDLPFGDEILTGEYTIGFDEVVSESRCPKEVSCVRSGEAIIKVSVYQNEKLIYTKKLIFNAEGTISEVNNMIYSNDDIRLMGTRLSPYPQSEVKIPNEEYVLEVKVN